MVRLFNVYHASRTLMLAGLEVLLILISFLAALFLLSGKQSYFLLTRPEGATQLVIVILTWLVCLYYFDVYNLQVVNTRYLLFSRLLQVGGAASLILAGIYLVFPDLVAVRGISAVECLLLLGLLFGCRISFAHWSRAIIRPQRVVLIGMSQLGRNLAREVRQRPEIGLELVGYIEDDGNGLTPPAGINRLGRLEKLEELITEFQPAAAVVALEDRRGRLPVDALARLRLRGLRIIEANSAYERITGKIAVDSVLPSWLIFSEGFRVHSRIQALQRVCSFGLALVVLVLASPLMVIIAVAIKLDSKGTILYRQKRIGKNGRIFTILKFRSMYEGAERPTGAVWAVENDPRVTRVGRFLRRSRLDELPQLLNILGGQMNFVGPRPERPNFVKIVEGKIPYYTHRHILRPGLTGWAQVRCGYGSTVEEQREKMAYDLFYIKNLSVSLDFYILLLTGKIILWGRGAK